MALDHEGHGQMQVRFRCSRGIEGTSPRRQRTIVFRWDWTSRPITMDWGLHLCGTEPRVLERTCDRACDYFHRQEGRNITVNIPPPAKVALGLDDEGSGRKKRPKKPKKETSSQPSGGGGEGADHPQKWGKQFITASEGHELCFRYAKGKPRDCPDLCKEGRVHGAAPGLSMRGETIRQGKGQGQEQEQELTGQGEAE